MNAFSRRKAAKEYSPQRKLWVAMWNKSKPRRGERGVMSHSLTAVFPSLASSTSVLAREIYARRLETDH